ncbi:uncharacterized protein MKZ38_002656 [Zalerion maritima]|uniref:CCHC-type domain-containing protein n=1 Tax=Zalerion maritima TaxID=339359 RepID=A0AAD5RYN2_9PEZI|nr:uncharacterized protein MKZ38_002656 [Zalerion maritima]
MAPGNPDKVASTRLMAMGFMQRALAKDGGSIPPPTIPNSSKKRKTDHLKSGNKADKPPTFDQAALNAAVAEEERKRQAALKERAKALGDSRWVLRDPRSVTGSAMQKPMNIVEVGFSQIDQDEEDGRHDNPDHRLRFNTKASRKQTNLALQSSRKQHSESGDGDPSESTSDSDSASEADDEHGNHAPRDQKPKVTPPAKRRAEIAKANMFAEKRRKKEINPNRLISISAAKSRSGTTNSLSSMVCYGCGNKGHARANCPQSGRSRSGRR